MSHELCFTSAPRGLRPGSNGYCTVVASRGLPGPLWQKLEALSDYQPLSDGAGGGDRNPVALSHLRVTVLGKTYSVLSRCCLAGVDHTHRGIFFAHHVALEAAELPPGGPAWLAGQRGFLESQWDGQVRELAGGRRPAMGNSLPAVCRAWGQAAGDPGWAGVLAEAFQSDPARPAYLLYPLGLDPLPLLTEALALLPLELRWQVTFATFFRPLPQDVACAWRCAPRESPAARKGRVAPGALVLDLGKGLGPARGGVLVEVARTGKFPQAPVPVLTRDVAPPQAPGEQAPESWAPARAAARPGPEPEGKFEVVPQVAVANVVRRAAAAADSPPPGGSWLAPFAVGLLAGMVLVCGAAAAGWHMLEQDRKKALKRANDEREQELQRAKAAHDDDLQSARDKARAERKAAVKQAEAAATRRGNRERAAAVGEVHDELQKAREEAAKQLRQEKAGRAQETAGLRQQIARRDEALAGLTKLFDVKDADKEDPDKYIKKITDYLKAMDGDHKDPPLEQLLRDWLRDETKTLTLEVNRADLKRFRDLQGLLRRCKEIVELRKKEAVEDREYQKTYDQAQKLFRELGDASPSLLIRKETERLKKIKKKLPKPPDDSAN
jgi:hypothetical protein